MTGIVKTDQIQGAQGTTVTVPTGNTLNVEGATTLTADLTVDTDTLKVDTTNDRVGINTASPAESFVVHGTGSTTVTRLKAPTSTQVYQRFDNTTSNTGYVGYNGTSLELWANNNLGLVIDSTGAVTKPDQPAFLVQASGQTNLSTNATTTIGFSAVFDQNSDFDSSTEKFTAPVTGKYQFNVYLRVDQVDNTSQYTTVRIVTSNRTIYGIYTNNGFDADLDYITYGISQLMDMDAGDTAHIAIYLPSLGVAMLDVTDASFWSGYLVC